MKIPRYQANHVKITSIAEGIIIRKKFEAVIEQIINVTSLITEEETATLSDEEKKAMDTLMATFVGQLKKDAAEVKADAADPKEIEKLKKEFPEVAKLENEKGELDEFVITGTLMAGILAAIPKLVELFGYLVNGIGTVLGKFGFKKASEKTKAFAKKIVHAGHELHEGYITVIQKALTVMIPGFNEIPENKQKKIAELLYMVILLYLGMDAGFNAFAAIKHASWVHVSIEGALSAIKGGELASFLGAEIPALVA